MSWAASTQLAETHFAHHTRAKTSCLPRDISKGRALHCVEACDRRKITYVRRAVGNKSKNSSLASNKVQTKARRTGPPSRHTGRLELQGVSPPPETVDVASVRRRLFAPPDNEQLPKLDALIIVEGFNDCLAVHRAVRSPIYVLGGAYSLAEEMKPELRYVAQLAAAGQLPRHVVVFTDPDWQGRMFRIYLDDLLLQHSAAAAAQDPKLQPQRWQRPKVEAGRFGAGNQGLVVRHAFLRVELGTSAEASRYHEAGNVGVEHAAPDTIRSCLVRARPGFGPGRNEFSVEQLRADGLIGSWDDKSQVMGPQLRRGRFCLALGLDEVGTGKGLVNLLNRYFTRAEYETALRVATSLVA